MTEAEQKQMSKAFLEALLQRDTHVNAEKAPSEMQQEAKQGFIAAGNDIFPVFATGEAKGTSAQKEGEVAIAMTKTMYHAALGAIGLAKIFGSATHTEDSNKPIILTSVMDKPDAVQNKPAEAKDHNAISAGPASPFAGGYQ